MFTSHLRLDVLFDPDMTAALANLTTVLVAVIGGSWILYLYAKNRRDYPRIKIEHEATSKEIGDTGAVLIRVVVRATNEGEGLLVIDQGFARLLRVKPWSKEFLDAAKQAVEVQYDASYVEENGTEVAWTMIAKRDLVEKQHVELEPGEQEEFCFDFVIKDHYKTILIYSYLMNSKKSKKLGKRQAGSGNDGTKTGVEERGWVKTTMFEIGDTN